MIYIPGSCWGFPSIISTVQIETEDVGKMTEKDSEHFREGLLKKRVF